MIDNSRIGLIGELEVMVELLKRGYNPSKSYLDNGVDLVLENRTLIQVKSITKPSKDGFIRACLAKGNQKKAIAYSKFVDFIIIYRIDTEDFFIIPAKELDFLTNLSIPTKKGLKNSKYLKFINSWDILRKGVK